MTKLVRHLFQHEGKRIHGPESARMAFAIAKGRKRCCAATPPGYDSAAHVRRYHRHRGLRPDDGQFAQNGQWMKNSVYLIDCC
jgi:hypothetical protein